MGEHYLDTVGVGSSILPVPTIYFNGFVDKGASLRCLFSFMEQQMSEIRIELPDGSVKELASGSTPYDVALSIGEGLAKASVNIDSMYLLHSNAEGYHFAVTVDDSDTASQALAG